jgi:transcriptional regulator with XRE-family HTH domain
VAKSFADGLLAAILSHAPDLSQSALAKRAGINASTLSRLLSGQRQPTRKTVNQLAKALRLSTAEADRLRLMAGFRPVEAGALYLNSWVRQLDRAVAAAPTHQQQWARDQIRALVSQLREGVTP